MQQWGIEIFPDLTCFHFSQVAQPAWLSLCHPHWDSVLPQMKYSTHILNFQNGNLSCSGWDPWKRHLKKLTRKRKILLRGNPLSSNLLQSWMGLVVRSQPWLSQHLSPTLNFWRNIMMMGQQGRKQSIKPTFDNCAASVGILWKLMDTIGDTQSMGLWMVKPKSFYERRKREPRPGQTSLPGFSGSTWRQMLTQSTPLSSAISAGALCTGSLAVLHVKFTARGM